MYKIQSKITFEEKELTQNQYITDNFIVTEVNDRKLIFVPGNTLFSVDSENKSLKEIDITQQAEQISKVKTMLGELKTENSNESNNILGYKTKSIKIGNMNTDDLKFSMNVIYAKIPGIEKTVYPEFMKFEQSKQFVNLNFEPNEVIVSMNSEIYMQGNLVQKHSTEITKIEPDAEDSEEFHEYLTYSYE